jgi:hypothetical protein
MERSGPRVLGRPGSPGASRRMGSIRGVACRVSERRIALLHGRAVGTQIPKKEEPATDPKCLSLLRAVKSGGSDSRVVKSGGSDSRVVKSGGSDSRVVPRALLIHPSRSRTSRPDRAGVGGLGTRDRPSGAQGETSSPESRDRPREIGTKNPGYLSSGP